MRRKERERDAAFAWRVLAKAPKVVRIKLRKSEMKKKTTKIKATPRATVHPNDRCKWIDGDPRGRYTVCGQPAELKADGNSKAYCPHHCSIAYLKPGERNRPLDGNREQPVPAA